jgi:chromosome partitioning protein
MIFAITNQKGGVGKTTTVLNLGVFLAVKEKRVLLIDIDPQSNLTSGLGVAHEPNSIEEVDNKEYKTIYDLLVNKAPAKEVIRKTRIENLSIIPSGIELAGAEVELVGALSRENILKKALDPVKDSYDYILIDCPPSLGLLTINSLVAADKVLIPVQSEYFALEGLGQLVNTITLIKGSLNQAMEIGGVILTMYDNRTNLSKDVAGEIEKYFDTKLFQSVIPRNIRLSEAPSHGLSIYEYARTSSGGLAYENLTDEIIERFDRIIMKRPNFNKSS